MIEPRLGLFSVNQIHMACCTVLYSCVQPLYAAKYRAWQASFWGVTVRIDESVYCAKSSRRNRCNHARNRGPIQQVTPISDIHPKIFPHSGPNSFPCGKLLEMVERILLECPRYTTVRRKHLFARSPTLRKPNASSPRDAPIPGGFRYLR